MVKSKEIAESGVQLELVSSAENEPLSQFSNLRLLCFVFYDATLLYLLRDGMKKVFHWSAGRIKYVLCTPFLKKVHVEQRLSICNQ